MKKLILILSISFIFFLISCNGQEELISTPSIIGLKIRDAEKIAEDKGLLVKVTKSDFSKDFPIDYIISQDPSPYVLVKKGRIINVVISSGPPKVLVPDLIGMNFKEAQEIIYENKLLLGKIEEILDPNVGVGIIIEQSPSPKTYVEEDTKIDLKISKGVLGQIPSLIGLSVDEAKSLIVTSGYNVGKVINKSNPAYPSGIVWNQDPAPLTYGSPDTIIDIYVNP
ncbi:MAG: PASTA domain-containing protein [Caldisericia bacterium]|nr:PASTA domain-containing protein [Caldisericia bacterium]NLI55493.1 PASTA domain-containing protein [bacterium]HQJ56545.1 PASTA domain-containing protein [Caldisericia bacterium]